mgnify:CR=1 FL=1
MKPTAEQVERDLETSTIEMSKKDWDERQARRTTQRQYLLEILLVMEAGDDAINKEQDASFERHGANHYNRMIDAYGYARTLAAANKLLKAERDFPCTDAREQQMGCFRAVQAERERDAIRKQAIQTCIRTISADGSIQAEYYANKLLALINEKGE